jgi:hypothetical protein
VLLREDAARHGAPEYNAARMREKESLSMKTRTQKSRRIRDQARMRRALLGLEALEGRQLMASDLVSLAPDSLFAIQDQTSQILDVLGNDTFESAYPGARQITAVSAGDRGGEFSISPDGRSVRYTPPPGFFSNENQSPATVGPVNFDAIFSDAENFTYVVDGAFEQAARVFVRPVVSRDSYEFDVNDQNLVLNVLSNDAFFPGYAGLKTITAISAATQEGTVSISADGKSLVYSPRLDFVGTEEFSYVVDDKYEAHVFVNVRTAVRSDHYGDYHSPFVRNDGTHVLNVLANDCYPSHLDQWSNCTQIDVERITSVEQPTTGGTVTIAADGRSLTYRSADNFSGSEEFSYVADGKYRASVTVRVGTPDDSVQFFQNDSEQTIPVLANDLFRDGYNGARVITSVSAAIGDVSIVADGKSVSYKPKQDWTGYDSFSYTVDGTLTATVTVYVRRTVQDDWVSVIENSAERVLDVMSNDQFPADYVGKREITHVTASQQGAVVKISADGKSLLYQPQKGFFGSDQLTYTVDGTQVASVNVYVWRPFQDSWSSVYQFTGDNVLDPMQLDSGYRLSQLAEYHGAMKITALGTPNHGGTAAISADGKHVLYTPRPEFHGRETFTYTVDGEFTGTITVSVNPSIFSDDKFNVEQNSQSNSLAVLSNDHFPANYRGGKQITAVSATKSGGAVSIDPTSALIRYTPAKDFYGRDSFTYTVDGVQTATVSVTVLRRLRDDRFHVSISSQENVLPVLVNDDFGSTYKSPKRITVVYASAGGGTVAIAADGRSVLYTPRAGFAGNDSFTYEVDGQFVATATVTVSDTRSLPAPRFSTASELEAYLKSGGLAKYADQFGKEVPRWGYLRGIHNDVVLLSAGDASSFNSAAPSHSDTNVQVAGVDEGDLVETDGNFLYVLTGQELVIVDAFPAKDAHVVSRYAFSGTPTAMFLKGNLLTVISHTTGGIWSGGNFIGDVRFLWPGIVPTDRGVTVTVLDITDRAAPQMLQETKLDGDYFDARAIDNFVYIVARSEFNPPAPRTICEDTTAEEQATYITNNYSHGLLSVVVPYIPVHAQKCVYESAESYAERASTFANDVLPHYTTYDKEGNVVRSGLLVDATDIYGDGGKYSSQLFAMLTIDITSPDPGPVATTGVLTGSDGYVSQHPVLFASAGSLYLFDAKSTNNPEEAVVTKAWQVQFDRTTGDIRPIATGQLPGTVLNQFSIDETDGWLRVATTNLSPTASRTENNVFVLRDDFGVLEFVGGIQDLAPTETIFSVRFFGDRGIVVTFRQIDPLFTIDLSDPSQPKVAGELKLPGFSTYIQPIDRDHVLTFGKGGPNGWDGPPQISLFNIHDLQRPTLIDQANVGTRTWSEDAWKDHHAVAYFPEYNVLAIPSNRTEYNFTNRFNAPWFAGYQSTEYHETFVFRIDTTSATRSDAGIQTLGRIVQDSTVRRSVRIEDSLYSIADGKIIIVNVLDPTDRRATVDFRLTPVADPAENQVPPGINTATPFDDDGLGKAITAAQKLLAQKLNISEQAGVMVTAERNGSQDHFKVVLRAGDKQYLFHASAAGEATEVQADFSFAAGAARQWHNFAKPLDTNLDGSIDPIDALLVINQLNRYGSRPLLDSPVPVRAITPQTIGRAARSFQVDTNGDGHLAPIDALLVFNYLNGRAPSQRGFSGEGEGESNIATAAAFVQIEFDTLVGTTTDLPRTSALSPSNSPGILENETREMPPTASFAAASILTTNSIAKSKRLTTTMPDNYPRLADTPNDLALVELMDELSE